jgi:predicted DNA binding CopG/RHH family protein
LLIPFHTVHSYQIDLTPEEESMAEEARESIREMRKELENMPALQRRLAESLIESRIEEMKELLIDNKIRKEYKLKKAEVNTGLADELFVIPE